MDDYPEYKLIEDYKKWYKEPEEIPQDIRKQLEDNPIQPFGTSLGLNPDQYVAGGKRKDAKGRKFRLPGAYPPLCNIDAPTQRALHGAPNWDQVWTEWSEIGTGYKSPPHIYPNFEMPFPGWGSVKFQRILGKGGYGEVWLTELTKVGKSTAEVCACKIIDLYPDSNLSIDVNKMFRELRPLMGINHPNLCTVFDFMPISDPQTHFPFTLLLLFMEPCQQDLIRFLEPQTAGIPELETLTLLVGAMRGLKYLHDNRIVHFDIKPANILIGYDNQTKLADFGSSIRFDQGQPMVIQGSQCRGTIGYKAPETRNSNEYIEAMPCDIFSMGRTIAYTLIGNDNFLVIVSLKDMVKYFRAIVHRSTVPSLSKAMTEPISRDMAKMVLLMILDQPNYRPNIDQIMANPLWSRPPISQ